MSAPVEKVLERLRGVKKNSSGWYAFCPAHGDRRKPSLTVAEGDDGRALVTCHKECTFGEIVAALGLEERELFPQPQNGHSKNGAAKRETSWEIRDAAGEVQAIHVRLDGPDGKDVKWKRPDGSWGLAGRKLCTMPLYRSELAKDWPADVPVPVVVVEGEKAADALAHVYPHVLGTVTGASQTPGAEALGVLRGRAAVLWPDNDDPGREHMSRVAENLAGIAHEVRVYEPEGMPDKGDAADHPAVISGDPKALAEAWAAARSWEPPAATPTLGENPTDDELRDTSLARRPGLAWAGDRWRYYNEDLGIWEEADQYWVKNGIMDVLEEAKPLKVRPTTSRLSSVEEFVRIKAAVDMKLWDADPNILVCRNGALDLTTMNLENHSREHFATSGVPYDYDDGATSAAWEKVLNDLILAHVGKDGLDFFQEFVGYTLTTDTRHELALWLTGRRGGGRSTVIEGMRAMLGPGRVGNLSLSDIARSQFGLTDIVGKTLLTAYEQPSNFLSTGGLINNLVSGEEVRVDRKHRDAINIVPRAKIAWAMNELPRIGNVDDGIFRRVAIIELPEIPREQRNEQVKEDVKESGAAILNWALEGLARLRARGKFVIPEKIKRAVEEYEESSDVERAFLEDRCELAARAWGGTNELRKLPEDERERFAEWCRTRKWFTGSQHLHAAYRDWCDDFRHKAKGIVSITSEWERLGLVKHREEGGRVWLGVRIK